MSTRIAVTYAVVSGAGVAGLLIAPRTRPLGGWWGSPEVGVWTLTVLASLCVGLAASVVWIGARRKLPELALLGAALAVLAAFSVVHCLATPPILRSSPSLSFSAGMIALPAGLAAGAPMLAPEARAARWIARRWQTWVTAWLVGSAAALSAAWFAPPRWLPSPGSTLEVPVVAVGVVGAGALVARHVRLYRIGRHPSSLVTAVAVAYLALVTVVDGFLVAASPAWWVARLLGLSSVLAAAGAALVLAQHQRSVAGVLAPVVSRDPLSALEVGLTPEVHAFVAALSHKDRSTRDHVVRVADLATSAAVGAGLSARRVRSIGLAALLHDLGKLVVPSAILTKDGPLTDAEFAEITTHPAAGAALLERSATLAPVADLVRWHHERYDGRGYPDALSGEEIPFEAAIVSVCDAWDAMTNDRHYRAGIGATRAEAILVEGAGSQWHPRAVAVVLDEIRTGPARGAFAAVGEGLHPTAVLDSVCGEAVAGSVCGDAVEVLATP